MPFLTKEKTNWKYILIILVLAAIVGGGILGYLRYFQKEISFLTKFPEIKKPEKIIKETTNWKTYRNEEYGFEIKYPESWNASEYVKTSIIIIEKKEGKKNERETAEIDISEEREGKSLEEVVSARMSSFARDVKQKEIFIGGERGYELIGKFCSSVCTGSTEDVYSTFVIIYFSHNNKIYTITYSEGITGVGWKESIGDYNYYDEFKKILSTFRFLE
jgi:hypothetical protein